MVWRLGHSKEKMRRESSSSKRMRRFQPMAIFNRNGKEFKEKLLTQLMGAVKKSVKSCLELPTQVRLL